MQHKNAGNAAKSGKSRAPFRDSGKRSIRYRILLLGVVSLLCGCEKYELDRRMDTLCAMDGGVRVFERVTLPKDKFDQNGHPVPGKRSSSLQERLGSEYRITQETTYLKAGDPERGEGQLARSKWQILRIADAKVLLEAVVYMRSGGDFIVLDHFSSKICPANGPGNLLDAVFTKGNA